MRKLVHMYADKTDKIVIVISLICLLLIALYKLCLLPIGCFSDINIGIKEEFADMIYTLVSSIFAASCFYGATIFLPKFSKKRKFTKDLPYIIKHIDELSKQIIENINQKTGKDYTLDAFLKEGYKDDFMKTYLDQIGLLSTLKVLFARQISYLNYISVSYGDVLEEDIVIEINYLVITALNVFDINDKEDYCVDQAYNIHGLITANLGTIRGLLTKRII